MTESKSLWWMLLIILIAITAFSLYKMIMDKEIPYIQFSIVAALSASVLRTLPLFLKYKYLNAIPVVAAVVLLILGIVTEINK